MPSLPWSRTRGVEVRVTLKLLSDLLDKIEDHHGASSSSMSRIKEIPKIKEIPEMLEELESRVQGYDQKSHQTPTPQNLDTDISQSSSADTLKSHGTNTSLGTSTNNSQGADTSLTLNSHGTNNSQGTSIFQSPGTDNRGRIARMRRVADVLPAVSFHRSLQWVIEPKNIKETEERLKKLWTRVVEISILSGNFKGVQNLLKGTEGSPTENLGWKELPKDDDSMLRLFEGINSHLKNHVINFYIAPNGKTFSPNLSASVSQDFDDMGSFEHLLSDQISRTFILRTIIADKVLKWATKEIPKKEILKERASSCKQGVYDDHFRTRIREFAKAVHGRMEIFVSVDSGDGSRLRSMEDAVVAAVDFALIMENQPTGFEFYWAPPAPDRLSSDQRVEVVHIAPSVDGRLKTQATVFPGLLKGSGEEGLSLAKAKALIY